MQCEELICETIFVGVDKVILFPLFWPPYRQILVGVKSLPHHHHTNEGPANLKEMQCEEFICDTIFVGVDKVMMIIE